MNTDLATIEKEALAFMNDGKKEQAALLFSKIIAERPDWEHGQAAYNLASCLEDLGELDQQSSVIAKR